MKDNREKLFEFYYLTELTLQKLKPLSRWEKPLDEKYQRWLKYKGLCIEIIPRKTILGKTVHETVFSTSSRYVDFYKGKFYNLHLKKTVLNQKLEGFLFGYPSCCVNQFIKHPYSHNHLTKDQQSTLFHWACPNCKVTPELIPYYKSIYKLTEEWFNHHFPDKRNETVLESYQKKIRITTFAILLSAGLTTAQTISDTTHYIPLPADTLFANGLTYPEEIYLGAYNYGSMETSDPFALFYKSIVDTLPTTEQTDRPYRIDHMQRGIINCPKCGLAVNMGYVKIVNPLRNLELDIPYLGLHFMEYGHFSYGDDQSFERINIDTLKRILYPFDVKHMLSVVGDTDGDGLTDAEEDSLWFDHSISDFDNDGVPDGAQIAEELTRLFPKLKETVDNIHSHIKHFPVYGLELCQVCGSIHNMGYIEIKNPENQRTIQIPYLALHSLANGSFAYNGEVHQNERTDVIELIRTMKTHTVFTDNDPDNDGLKNNEEEYFNLDTDKIDTDNNGITDAKELALKFVDSIKALPTEPRTDGPYIEYLGMDGIHLCTVCGEEVVMGIMKIYNPLINTIEPFEMTNYAFHFLEKGSFEHEDLPQGRPEYWGLTNRIDPILLSQYLNINITEIKQESIDKIPERYSLEQNYPNPFNPSTIISWQSPMACWQTLKVYDILGNEVVTLFDGYKRAGSYTVEFNASELKSGVYFYRLQAGEFSITKKSLFIK